MFYLYEGGNVFDNTEPVAKADVATVVNTVKLELPSALQRKVIADIGSAGYKVESGDIDLFIDERAAVKNFGSDNAAGAKQALAQYFQAKGFRTAVKGRNVHVAVPYTAADGKPRHAQIDLMIIADAKRVADWHQHGPRGMYADPKFKASHLYILLNSIAKFKNMKVDAFAGTLNNRDADSTMVSKDRAEIAKILLNPSARASDLDSAAAVMKALEGDPDREGKLAQARQDVAKGVLTLPETAPTPGTAAWFRSMGHGL
jgi:hypothetical protein